MARSTAPSLSLLSRSMHSNLLMFATTLTTPTSSSCLLLHSRRCCIAMLSHCSLSFSLSSHNNPHFGARRLIGQARQWRTLATRATTTTVKAHEPNQNGTSSSQVRVRFAPSPTGNLHVGGARTALFNYLFARSKGGKFVLRIEDTDLERSTKESEEAMIQDLHWLGLDWDEGPDKGGYFGPYRQSERTDIYREYANKLLLSGHAYRCFCTDEELETMRQIAKEKNLPPRYTGRWAAASQEEIEEELQKGTPFTYRFRVPQEGSVTIDDLVRGEVSWSNDTLGDFVILRSNGQPVYNFCVAVDDATMQISHVIRAEEHLPNTLRQVLIYSALKLPMPQFGHVSLILAPDRSKLSKRHGATSVGQFKEMGFLPEAMVNYLALLGWNDGSEDEIFAKEEIVKKFTLDRITKSAAIFDQTKLRWINGQHLRALPSDRLYELFGDRWCKAEILSVPSGPFVTEAVELLKNGIDLVSDADAALIDVLSYPIQSALRSDEAKEVVLDNLKELAEVIILSHESGELFSALDSGAEGWQKWIKNIGKLLKRKGKRLFMPVRVLLTGKMHGPDIGSTVLLIHKAQNSGVISSSAGFIPISRRLEILKGIEWNEILNNFNVSSDSMENVPSLLH